jgi:hypothetical protein
MSEYAKRQQLYLDFVVDEAKINHERLKRSLFLGSDAFVCRLQEYYAIKSEIQRI